MHNLNYTPTTLEYKIEEKLYLGVREEERLNTTALDGLIPGDKAPLPIR
jgi:hypothetical protein